MRPADVRERTPSEDPWDAVLVGAGHAGLLLARALIDGPLAGGRVLLVDPRGEDPADHSVAWWSPPDHPLVTLAQYRWSRLAVVDDGGIFTGPIAPLHYQFVLDPSLRASLLATLLDRPEVTLIEARVDGWTEEGELVRLQLGEAVVRARWLFDSRWEVPARVEPPHVLLRQSFRGWTLRSPTPRFDPDAPVFMDLRRSQEGAVRFAYLLPLDPHTAFVELVAIGAEAEFPEIDPWLQTADLLGCTAEERERGVTPMTDRSWPRRLGPRSLAIGIRGGLLKPSSGYALDRMARDAGQVADSLVRCGHPFALSKPAWRWRLLDAWMLRLMQHRPADAARALAWMFRRQGPAAVLRFLDERASILEIVRLGLSLPVWPMVWAFGVLVRDHVRVVLGGRPAA